MPRLRRGSILFVLVVLTITSVINGSAAQRRNVAIRHDDLSKLVWQFDTKSFRPEHEVGWQHAVTDALGVILSSNH